MKAHRFADIFPMLPQADIESLAVDIKANGLRNPIVIYCGEILDGRNRLAACEIAGIEPIFDTFEGTEDEALSAVVSWNLERRHLTSSQKAAVGAELEPLLAELAAQAKQRQSEGGREKVPQMFAEAIPDRNARETAAQAAKAVGSNRSYMQDAVKLRQEEPEIHAQVKAGSLSIPQAKLVAAISDEHREVVLKAAIEAPEENKREAIKKAIGQVKLDAKRALCEQIKANPIVTPDGRYSVIVADPPWRYDTGEVPNTLRGMHDYPDMDTGEICDLRVPDMAQKDSFLWLWTTNLHMPHAYRVLEAWGFEAKTILTWDKRHMGVGRWLRAVTEHCIMAVKGSPVINLTNQTTLISETRREHSRKPDCFYKLVEELCPGSKLELFSREPRVGWVAWGAETGKFSA